MKLTTLKSGLQTLRSRVSAMPFSRPGTVERKRGSAGVKDRSKIKQRDCGLCQLCKQEGRVTLGTVVDHRVPLWAGGSDEDENKWLLCNPCHDAKTKREAQQRAKRA